MKWSGLEEALETTKKPQSEAKESSSSSAAQQQVREESNNSQSSSQSEVKKALRRSLELKQQWQVLQAAAQESLKIKNGCVN